MRPIKVGPTDGNFEAVLSGLKPGDRVVTDGTDRLRDGAAVTLPAAGARKRARVRPAGQAPDRAGRPSRVRRHRSGPGGDPKAQHEHHRPTRDTVIGNSSVVTHRRSASDAHARQSIGAIARTDRTA